MDVVGMIPERQLHGKVEVRKFEPRNAPPPGPTGVQPPLDRRRRSREVDLKFGQWRGLWLDQVHDDASMTGDFFRVMYAISRHRNSKTRVAMPGNVLLAEAAHVTVRMVQRALHHAAERGHVYIEDQVGKPRAIKPILREVQNCHPQIAGG